MPEDSSSINRENNPVNVERGRKIYECAQEAIVNFQTKYAPTLDGGKLTIAAFNEQLAKFGQGDQEIMVFDHDIGQYLPWSGELRLSPDIVDRSKSWLTVPLQAIGIQVNENDLERLAVKHIVFHELGHAFQRSFQNLFPRTSGGAPAESLSAAALKCKVIHPHPALSTTTSDGRGGPTPAELFGEAIDNDRFAEGFAQMFVAEEVAETYGLDDATKEHFRTTLAKSRGDAPKRIAELIKKHESHIGNVHEELKEQDLGLLDLAYGTPHPPEAVLAQIKFTRFAEPPPRYERPQFIY